MPSASNGVDEGDVPQKQSDYHYIHWSTTRGSKPGWRCQCRVPVLVNIGAEAVDIALRFELTTETWASALAWGVDAFHSLVFKELHKVSKEHHLASKSMQLRRTGKHRCLHDAQPLACTVNMCMGPYDSLMCNCAVVACKDDWLLLPLWSQHIKLNRTKDAGRRLNFGHQPGFVLTPLVAAAASSWHQLLDREAAINASECMVWHGMGASLCLQPQRLVLTAHVRTLACIAWHLVHHWMQQQCDAIACSGRSYG